MEYGLDLSFDSIGTGTRVPVTGTTYNLMGLTPASPYCYFVREICGVGDTSSWRGPVCFTTSCIPVVTAPYSTDFEGITIGILSTYENCWSVLGQAGAIHWESEDAGGYYEQYLDCGPFYDATFPGVAGGTYMYVEPSYSKGDDELYSPIFDVSALANPELEYYYHLYGATANKLEIYAEDVTGARLLLDSIIGQQQTTGSDSFAVRNVSLASVTYNTFRIVFKGYSAYYCGSISIDEVSIQEGVSCPMPTAITTDSKACDSITISWFSASGGSYMIYGPTGFIPPAGSSTGVVTSPYTISGLAPGTAYDFYIADTCTYDTSKLAGPYTETTDSLPPVAAFTYSIGSAGPTNRSLTVNASSSVGAGSYLWDFGDGNIGTGMIDSNAYSANGTYTVSLIVNNACGSDTVTDAIVIQGIGIDESLLCSTLELYPNPASTHLSISFSRQSPTARIALVDLSVKELLVKEINDAEGFYSGHFDISDLSDGVYLIRIRDGESIVNRSLIKR